jgi:hypothetical protein
MELTAVLVAVVVLVAGAAAMTFLGDDDNPWSPIEEPGSEYLVPGAGPQELPPSERGELPATTLPPLPEAGAPAPGADPGGEPFVELTCRFSGTSLLDEPLASDGSGPGAPNRMELEPGAAFDCDDGGTRSSGTIELSAEFESLSAFSGIASGQGRIVWSELPGELGVPSGPASVSTTGVEVELAFPAIVVWTTILDGPYAGYRGRLVLTDWEPLFGEGGIIGTRFNPTEATFAPR